MKNVIKLTVLALLFAACRKERTCDCTYSITEGSQTTTFTTSYTMGNATKREARIGKGSSPIFDFDNNCFSTKEVETNNGIQTITTKDCKLK